MTLRLMLLAMIFAVLLSCTTAAVADEQFDDIASDQEVGYLYRAALGPSWSGAPSHPPYWAPGGDRFRGARVGSPYYWSATGSPGPGGYGVAPFPGYAPPPYPGGYAYGTAGYGSGYGLGVGYGMGPGYGNWSGAAGDPFGYHFGPGFHRHSNYGHYRFPYYSYRAPWYAPGPPVYNRDTNFPW
jgi:hypothetical protein